MSPSARHRRLTSHVLPHTPGHQLPLATSYLSAFISTFMSCSGKPLLCGAQRTDFSSGHTHFLTSFYQKHSIFFFPSIKVQLLILLVLHPHVFPEMPSEITFTSTNRTVSFFFLFFKIDKTALKLPPVFCSCSFYLPE